MRVNTRILTVKIQFSAAGTIWNGREKFLLGESRSMEGETHSGRLSSPTAPSVALNGTVTVISDPKKIPQPVLQFRVNYYSKCIIF